MLMIAKEDTLMLKDMASKFSDAVPEDLKEQAKQKLAEEASQQFEGVKQRFLGKTENASTSPEVASASPHAGTEATQPSDAETASADVSVNVDADQDVASQTGQDAVPQADAESDHADSATGQGEAA